MIHLLVQPSPSPSPTDVTIDATHAGSPGFLGFVFTFLVAIAAVFLFLSLTKQMRRVDRRAKQLGLDEEPADPFADDPPVDGAVVDDPDGDELGRPR